MCLWCISAIGGGWWIMYPSPSSLAHSLTERGGQKVRNFRAFQSPSNIINPPRMQKWNLPTIDLESNMILDVLFKYHKSRVLFIKWSQFFLGSAVNLFKNEFAPSESADKKGASTPMGESSEDVIREEEIAKVSILTYLKSDQQQGYLVNRFLLLPPVIIIRLQMCEVVTSSAPSLSSDRVKILCHR